MIQELLKDDTLNELMIGVTDRITVLTLKDILKMSKASIEIASKRYKETTEEYHLADVTDNTQIKTCCEILLRYFGEYSSDTETS